MGLRNWFRHKLSRFAKDNTVRFYDIESQQIISIPQCELRPGLVQVKLNGIEELVWISPDQLTPGAIIHKQFDEDILDYIRKIRDTFSEHRDLSIAEWEDGFRRDIHPEREIALWSHAADIYIEFTENEISTDRRRDIYRCIVACLTTTPDTVWNILKPQAINLSVAEKIVSRFYGKNA